MIPPAITTGNLRLSICRSLRRLPSLPLACLLRRSLSLLPGSLSLPLACLAFAWLTLASARLPRRSAHRRSHPQNCTYQVTSLLATNTSLDQALDRLVSTSSIRYRTSTADLSTLSSSRGLTCSRSGNLLLEGGFTLRCLQRLSRPHFASLLCRWHDNSCTSDASIPVLSY